MAERERLTVGVCAAVNARIVHAYERTIGVRVAAAVLVAFAFAFALVNTFTGFANSITAALSIELAAAVLGARTEHERKRQQSDDDHRRRKESSLF